MSRYYARWSTFEVTWRDLTWAEYNKFKRSFDTSPFEEPMEVALGIYKATLVNGPDPKFVPAGIAAFVCKQQMLNNPFSGSYNDVATAIGAARKIVSSNYLLSAKALISSTLHYKMDEIDSWDPSTFFIRLAQTEVVNGRTFDPVDPNVPKSPSGKPLPQSIKKNLSSSQLKAIERAREDRGR